MEQHILIVTSKTDATASFICEKLLHRSLPFIRFDTDDFPTIWSASWDMRTKNLTFESESANFTFSAKDIASVWYRRPQKPIIPEDVENEVAREFAQKDGDIFLESSWQSIQALWVSHPSNIRRATKKLIQLSIAESLGFLAPRTLVTSNPRDAVRFIKDLAKPVVFKPLHQDALIIKDTNYFAFTKIVDETVLEHIELVKYAPTIFQEHIPPKYEIRVTVFGKKIYAARIPREDAEPDWRHIPSDQQAWEMFELPRNVEESCKRLIEYFGLNYGAIDLICDEHDSYYFLELNANGQWVWIELLTEVPMSDSMIDLLSSRIGMPS